MIGFFFACIVIGILLTAVLTPIVMVANVAKLREMERIIKDFEALTEEGRNNTRSEVKRKLIALKAGIVADKKSTEKAADLLSLV